MDLIEEKKYSVILINQATGKIALLVETMIPNLIEKALLKFSIELREGVETYISDISPTLEELI